MSSGAGRDLAGVVVSTLIAICLAACGSSGPTGSSELDLPPSAASRTDLSFGPSISSELGSGAEDFDCTAVETVRVRFSSPGYVEYDRVGLYVFFAGLPEGPKRIRIWWDNENDPIHFRDFVFPEEATEIEEVYEHRYVGLARPTEMLVRVELIRDGLTGNCPRNRRVLVSPPGGTASSPSAPTTQTANVGPSITAVDNYDFFFYSEGVRFTALTPLTIDRVWVDPAVSGTLGISLWDSSGSTLLNSTSMAVAAGPQQVGVGFSVPPGDYILTLDGTTVGFPGMGVTFGGASYPYEIPGVIRLTDTAFFFGSLYFFLYDWQVTW